MASERAGTAAEGKESKPDHPWLHAWHDPVAGLKAYSSCVRFADLSGDGDNKLLVADLDRKLRIYSGTGLMAEHTLLDVPVALCTFYTDMSEPRTPAVAVASGPYVFIYRNLRPYFKFTLPPLDIDRQEQEVWNDLRTDKIDAEAAFEMLSVARDSGTLLSSRSLDLLGLEDPDARAKLVAKTKGTAPMQQTVITCMETLNKDMDGLDQVSSLVIGTESKQVLILDPPGSSILVKCTLPGVPVFMAVSGLYSVEYRIVVACRDGNVYTIKNGEVTSTVIELQSHPCGIVRMDKAMIIGTMDNAIHNYHIKGKKSWSLYMPCKILSMALLQIRRTRIVNCLLVALENGELRTYFNKSLAATLKVDHPISALRFGPYGREDNTLTYVTKNGALHIKMLRRTANLEVPATAPGPPPEQDVPLKVPKKTRLYVEQTQRERDQATEMHRIFQRDLCKLRLATARSYVKIITDGQGPMSVASGVSLRINANVAGLGPQFKIKLNVQNTGTSSMWDVPVTFSYNHELYRLGTSLLMIPLLIPGQRYVYEVPVQCIDEAGGADVVKVFVCSPTSSVPVISAFVTMPISEALATE